MRHICRYLEKSEKPGLFHCSCPVQPVKDCHPTERIELAIYCPDCPCRSPAKSAKPPNLGKRIVRYGSSTLAWMAVGSPERPDEEVERIAGICKACEHFAKGKCNLCGCAVKGVAEEGITRGMLNKIRRATENCPVEKW